MGLAMNAEGGGAAPCMMDAASDACAAGSGVESTVFPSTTEVTDTAGERDGGVGVGEAEAWVGLNGEVTTLRSTAPKGLEAGRVEEVVGAALMEAAGGEVDGVVAALLTMTGALYIDMASGEARGGRFAAGLLDAALHDGDERSMHAGQEETDIDARNSRCRGLRASEGCCCSTARAGDERSLCSLHILRCAGGRCPCLPVQDGRHGGDLSTPFTAAPPRRLPLVDTCAV